MVDEWFEDVTHHLKIHVIDDKDAQINFYG